MVDAKMLSLFLGAGFSKWASDLPLVKDLFDFDILIRGSREEAKLVRIRKLKSYWDYHNPSEYPEKFIAYAHAFFRKTLKFFFGISLGDSAILFW